MPRFYETGSLILQDVLFRANERTDLSGTTSDYLAAAKKYVQRAYEDILGLHPWPWALADPPGVLSIVAKITGTATCTLASASVTLGATIATSMAGRWFEIDNEGTPYRILAHTAGTAAITLDTTYKEASVAGGTFTIYKDEYDLASDCLKIWWAWNRNNPSETIDIIPSPEMHELHTRRSVSALNSRRMSVVRGNKVRITPWPETDDITIEYEYTKKPAADLTFDAVAGTDTPTIPLNDRSVIADAALILLLTDKNDARLDLVSSVVREKLTMMVSAYISPGTVRFYVPSGKGIWK